MGGEIVQNSQLELIQMENCVLFAFYLLIPGPAPTGEPVPDSLWNEPKWNSHL